MAIITEIKGHPTQENGIEKGVSACYAGTIAGQLVMTGGCNFPEKPVTEGGIKRYYKGIYAAKPADGDTLAWQQVGEMPVEAAYGVAVSVENGMVIVGGNNATESFNTVYHLTMDSTTGAISCCALPTLPCVIDNMGGAVLDSCVYVVGGNQDGKPSNAVYMLDLKNLSNGWQRQADMPGKPRVQPACAAINGKVYVFGGFSTFTDGTKAVVAQDALVLDVAQQTWKSITVASPEEGKNFTLSASAVTIDSKSRMVFAGAVNHDIFLDAISGTYALVEKADYMHKPVEWYAFNPYLLSYHPATNSWEKPLLKHAELARAGASLVCCNDAIYIIGGEMKPGIRSNRICKIKVDE